MEIFFIRIIGDTYLRPYFTPLSKIAPIKRSVTLSSERNSLPVYKRDHLQKMKLRLLPVLVPDYVRQIKELQKNEKDVPGFDSKKPKIKKQTNGLDLLSMKLSIAPAASSKSKSKDKQNKPKGKSVKSQLTDLAQKLSIVFEESSRSFAISSSRRQSKASERLHHSDEFSSEATRLPSTTSSDC
jgi:hypothetical protein